MSKIRKIFRILLVFPAIFCSGCKTNTKTDVESYRDILSECINDKDFHSQLYIFPESIEGLEVTKFVFANRTDLFNGSWLMYLGIKFDESSFNNELVRLDEVKAVYKTGDVKPIIKYEEQSLYLTINKDNRYEYAMFNKESFEVVYVSNQLFEWKDTPVISEHILPSVTIPIELDDGNNTYNMYYRYEGDTGWEVTD